MFRLLLSCVVVIATTAITPHAQMINDFPGVERLVNSSLNQINNDIRFYNALASALSKSFREKLEVIDFIQNLTEVKYHETGYTLNRMALASNRSRFCVATFRNDIWGLDYVQTMLHECTDEARDTEKLIEQVYYNILSIQNNLQDYESTGVRCIESYSENPDTAMLCVERNIIEKHEKYYRGNFKAIVDLMEDISKTYVYNAKKAQHCVYSVTERSNSIIDINLERIKTCIQKDQATWAF